MFSYQAPLKDMQFLIDHLMDSEGDAELDADTIRAVLDEAARFAREVLSPLNQSGDREGASLDQQQVTEAEGFAEAYRQFVEGGWPALPCNPQYGGSGLPLLIAGCVAEMWSAANSSFALCPMLGQGAITAIEKHASAELQQQYLDKLVSGEWTGTMNLTEPQAGSDLAAVRCKAEPHGDHYLISGTKIFITWGDHSMTDNIVHLVLARTPDSPEGVKGISLFVVPKFILNENAEPDKRNDAYPVSIEHKMGIHASPTCVMSYGENGGAIGYLVGEENYGLVYMFTMMNHARLNVGLQGVALAEGAYQQARDYALERVQGVAPGGNERGAIIQHPDVRRMLLLMKALTEASRAICYVTGAAFDKAEQACQALGDLLTPVAKAWSTEIAQEVTSLAVQVHGGMGFIEETGIAQFYRDTRITTIYEGTTAIQANDFIGRKFLRDGGQVMNAFIAQMREDCSQADRVAADLKALLQNAIDELESSCQLILENAKNESWVTAVAFNFLMQAGTVMGAWQLLKAAQAAHKLLSEDESFYQAKITTAQFYCHHVLPRAAAYASAIETGDDAIMAMSEQQF